MSNSPFGNDANVWSATNSVRQYMAVFYQGDVKACIGDVKSIHRNDAFTLKIGDANISCVQQDFGVSYVPFMGTSLTVGDAQCRDVAETNRCFFLHLGMAVEVHPWFLGVAMRKYLYDNQNVWDGKGSLVSD